MSEINPVFVQCQNPKCKLYGVRKLALRMGDVVQIKHRGIQVIIQKAEKIYVTCPSCRRSTSVYKTT